MIVALALFGKLLIGGAYSLVYLYATELMPTLLRTYGLGTASMVGRIGSILAPYVVDLLVLKYANCSCTYACKFQVQNNIKV